MLIFCNLDIQFSLSFSFVFNYSFAFLHSLHFSRYIIQNFFYITNSCLWYHRFYINFDYLFYPYVYLFYYSDITISAYAICSYSPITRLRFFISFPLFLFLSILFFLNIMRLANRDELINRRFCLLDRTIELKQISRLSYLLFIASVSALLARSKWLFLEATISSRLCEKLDYLYLDAHLPIMTR